MGLHNWPLLHRVDVLRRVDGPLEPRGPHLEVGGGAQTVEVAAQLPRVLQATRGLEPILWNSFGRNLRTKLNKVKFRVCKYTVLGSPMQKREIILSVIVRSIFFLEQYCIHNSRPKTLSVNFMAEMELHKIGPRSESPPNRPSTLLYDSPEKCIQSFFKKTTTPVGPIH
jgi:hypothetical protein